MSVRMPMAVDEIAATFENKHEVRFGRLRIRAIVTLIQGANAAAFVAPRLASLSFIAPSFAAVSAALVLAISFAVLAFAFPFALARAVACKVTLFSAAVTSFVFGSFSLAFLALAFALPAEGVGVATPLGVRLGLAPFPIGPFCF